MGPLRIFILRPAANLDSISLTCTIALFKLVSLLLCILCELLILWIRFQEPGATWSRHWQPLTMWQECYRMYSKCTQKVCIASQWDFWLHSESSELIGDLFTEGFPIDWKVMATLFGEAYLRKMGVSSWGLDLKPYPHFRDAVPHHRIADQVTMVLTLTS